MVIVRLDYATICAFFCFSFSQQYNFDSGVTYFPENTLVYTTMGY